MRTVTFLLTFILATAAAAAPLDVVTVGFPAINCKFDRAVTAVVTAVTPGSTLSLDARAPQIPTRVRPFRKPR